MNETVVFFGINVSLLDISELTKKIQLATKLHRQLTISYMNFHTTNTIVTDPDRLAIFNAFDIIVPDGFALTYALSVFEKFNPNNFVHRHIEPWMPTLYSLTVQQKLCIYLLGGEAEVVLKSVENLKQNFDGLRIVGNHHGHICSGEESQRVIDYINHSGAEILLVGMGQPKQEEWIIENRNKINALVIIAVGGYFDKVSLNANAYPSWVYSYRLFWLYRLIKEPRRLWKRYTIGIVMFGWHVLLEKLRK